MPITAVLPLTDRLLLGLVPVLVPNHGLALIGQSVWIIPNPDHALIQIIVALLPLDQLLQIPALQVEVVEVEATIHHQAQPLQAIRHHLLRLQEAVTPPLDHLLLLLQLRLLLNLLLSSNSTLI